ncbi:MAG: hypothetical protein LQ352_004824 [Teloschistes flavicans]|nr:MAG: hypothetical protein LQ352_004824 [Teloschistes flavicans]
MNPASNQDGPLYLQQLLEELHARANHTSSTTALSAVLLVLLGYQILYWLDYPVLPMSELIWNSAVRATPSKLLYTLESAFLPKPSEQANPATEQSDSQKHAQKSEAIRRLLGWNGNGILSKWQGARSDHTTNSFPSSKFNTSPPGLGNWDNSCYQNSVIQGLASLSSFSEFLHRPDMSGNSQSTRAALGGIIQRLKDQANLGSMFWTPAQLKSMSSWQQQDAQEYFSKLMDDVEREVVQAAEKEVDHAGLAAVETLLRKPSDPSIPRADPVEEIQSSSAARNRSLSRLPDELQSIVARNPLEGLLAQRVGCLKCGFVEGLSLIPFNCLTLPLGRHWLYDIRSCLDEYTDLEPISGVDCAKCTILQSKTQLEKIWDQFSNTDGQALQSSAPLVTEVLKASVKERLQAVNEALEIEDFSENTIVKKCQISPKSKVSSTKTRQAVIARAPRSLAIHINRSVFDETTGMLSKNYADVRFPLRFDLKPWCLGGGDDGETWNTNPAESMLRQELDDEGILEGSRYELRAALTHYGRHENGHYVCYRRHEASAKSPGETPEGDPSPWWRFSDEDVSPVDEANVLAQGDVFMLFYERIDDPLPSTPIHIGTSIEQPIPEIEEARIQNAIDQDPPVQAQSNEQAPTPVAAMEIAKDHDKEEASSGVEIFQHLPPDQHVKYPGTDGDIRAMGSAIASSLPDKTFDRSPAHEPISETQGSEQGSYDPSYVNTIEVARESATRTMIGLLSPSDTCAEDPSSSPAQETEASPLNHPISSSQSDLRNIPHNLPTPTPRSGRGSMSRGKNNTIDLQAQDSPSAKDHTRQPAHPAPYGDGPPAPHQERALKHAEQETAVELHHSRSPRVSQDLSGKELQLLQEDGDGYVNPDLISPHQDAHHNQRNGSLAGAGTETDSADTEGSDDMDDDVMDKISSSPSIDEGGYSTPLPWPSRADSLHPAKFESTPLSLPQHDLSSFPFVSTPVHFPLSQTQKEQDLRSEDHHHHQGGYEEQGDQSQQMTADDSFSSELRDTVGPLISEQQQLDAPHEWEGLSQSYDTDIIPTDFDHLLLPPDDPLLDNSFDDADLSSTSTDSSPVRYRFLRADSERHADEVEQSSSEDNDNDSFEDDADDDDDDTEDLSFIDDPRYIDSGWGGECLRDTEDIDFEFVYALHTFVATVEGQANATKGDTMVLLDDSNSYWWLVRVAKDSSIGILTIHYPRILLIQTGYLPAEHIETPTERLARLNKHRNIDLSRGWVTDAQEKSRNPLKKAIKRRGRSVQFAPREQYKIFDASEVEHSSEEEEEEEEGEAEYQQTDEERSEHHEGDQDPRQDDKATVEPLKAGAGDMDITAEPKTQFNHNNVGADPITGIERVRTSDEIFESTDDGISGKSRKGTVRVTDSFFKDDTETRKINLTPSLLRDDSSGSTVRSNDAKEVHDPRPASDGDSSLTQLQLKNRPSLESLEKNAPSPEKSKDDRKRKEKKGMLSGFFKRKDKKGKSLDDSGEDGEKTSEEISRLSPQPSRSFDSLNAEVQTPRVATQPQPQRQTSKLQKSPPSKLSPKGSINRGESPSIKSVISEPQRTNIPPPSRSPPKLNMEFESTPLAEPEPQQPGELTAAPVQRVSPNTPRHEPMEIESPKDHRRNMFSPIRDVLRSSPSTSEPKPEKATRAKHRMPIDDFDSSSESEAQPLEPSIPRERSLSPEHEEAVRDGLSISPAQVSPQEQGPAQHPPALMIDTSSQDEPSTSPVSPLSSAELVEVPNGSTVREETPASTAQSSTNAPSWSDAHLRAYLDDGSEIRDLLVVVNHKADVTPAPPDHPLVKNLYKEENRKLSEMSTRLDGLLGDWLAKKSKTTPR